MFYKLKKYLIRIYIAFRGLKEINNLCECPAINLPTFFLSTSPK